MRPHVLLPALLVAVLLASCADRGPEITAFSPEGESYEEAARANARAIAEGMMRAREDRLRREVRRMIAPQIGRPPG